MRNPRKRHGRTTYFAESADRCRKLPAPKQVIEQATEAGVEDLYQAFYTFMSLATHGHDMMSDRDDPEAGLIEDL